jgi:hypothetical protein
MAFFYLWEHEMKNLIFLLALSLVALMKNSGYCASAAEECPPAGGWSFVCGPAAAEDLVRVAGTQWIVGSGMIEGRNPGKLHLIDTGKKTWEILYPGANPRNQLDSKSYPACAGAPDALTFGAHGIAIRADNKKTSTLLAVNHGREAIEVFKIDTDKGKPSILWVGCVPMAEGISLNSVAFLPKGGFVATKFYDTKTPDGFAGMMAQKVTGGVLEWHPETGVQPIAGTELSGANGIEVSKDGRTLYVAAWGTQEVVRFVRGKNGIQKTVVKLDFMPDNLRWAPDGRLLVAGQNRTASPKGGFAGFKGWTVIKLDPKTMQVTGIAKDAGDLPLQNVSVAIEVDGALWIGPFRGDRVAFKRMTKNE